MIKSSENRMELDYLNSWFEKELSKWNEWKNNGNTPREDSLMEDELYSTLYNREFRTAMIKNWDRKKYVEFRKHIIQSTFETIFFKEALRSLSRLNPIFEFR